MAIKIAGTSHIAKQSVESVKGIIGKWRPDFVAVELDVQRYNSLLQRRRRKISVSSIRQMGFFGYVFARFGSWFQNKLGEGVGVLPGEEMLSAVSAAKETNSKIVFIDKPITLVLQQISRIPVWEKLKLLGYVMAAAIGIGAKIEIDMSKVPEQRVVEQLTNELKRHLPALHKILIIDRDVYMVHQLKHLQAHYPDAKILAVVGAGHTKGITERLRKRI
jgi:pheromone shutdown-related protein TraB